MEQGRGWRRGDVVARLGNISFIRGDMCGVEMDYPIVRERLQPAEEREPRLSHGKREGEGEKTEKPKTERKEGGKERDGGGGKEKA